jgi:hypothetical protein
MWIHPSWSLSRLEIDVRIRTENKELNVPVERFRQSLAMKSVLGHETENREQTSTTTQALINLSKVIPGGVPYSPEWADAKICSQARRLIQTLHLHTPYLRSINDKIVGDKRCPKRPSASLNSLPSIVPERSLSKVANAFLVRSSAQTEKGSFASSPPIFNIFPQSLEL